MGTVLHLVVFLFLASANPATFNLGGTWQVTNMNGSISIPGIVPGEIHTDLLRNKIIGDPYYRFGDSDYSWVAKDNWTYSRTFTLDSTITSGKKIELIAEGLDTVAQINLNGHIILSADNMFRRYIVDITNFVVTGMNNITVAFESALTYAAQQAAASSVWNPPDCPPPEQNGFCYIQYIRKEPCSFSWDWGPAFAPQGIWKPIYIQSYNDVVIRDVSVETRYDSFASGWNLDVDLYFASQTATSAVISLELFDSKQTSLGYAYEKVNVASGELKTSIGLTTSLVQPWFPVGYGSPNLYSILVTLTAADGATNNVTRQIGFRTVRLVQEPLPGGTSFYFSVNDVPVFVKGANWIPADSFESRVTYDTLRNLLVSYKESNFNTLRVWGGGIYQHDDFYTLADELGLLVWQEFVFACALYQTDGFFLNNVALEVRDQIRRLQYHPSIILWSGNNENEVAISDNWYGVSNQTFYAEQYGALYFGTILSNLSLYDTTRPTAGSSPSNGNESLANPVESNPQNIWSGDVHYYNYDADCWDVTTFPRPRFASEYGFQSFPSFISISEVSNGSQGDWDWNSPFTLGRQHHPDGQSQIINQMALHFKVPNSTNSTQKYMDTLWMSQVSSGQCIKSETEHYRRLMTECDGNTGGCTMGTLYWQANDIWQGASWASIEYSGRWKVLQYLSRHFYSPVLASTYAYNGTGATYVVNELGENITGMLTYTMWSWDSLTPLNSWTVNFTKKARTSGSVNNFTLSDLLAQGKCLNASQCVLTYSIGDGNVTWSRNHYFLSSFTSVPNYQLPKLKVTSVTPATNNPEYAATFNVTFTSSAIAPFVWLETPLEGHFSDNAFLWTPQYPTSVSFYTRDNTTTADALLNSLSIWSLWDIMSH